MSLDSAEAWRAWLAELAAADPRARRFGARSHGYRATPPLGEERVRAVEDELGLRLPDDHRSFVATIAGGGAGPYHGLLPLDHPVQRRCAAGSFPFAARVEGQPADDAVYAGVIAVGHVGCGYLALLVVRGAAAGEVWLDARDAGAGLVPIAPSFGTYLQDWIERTAQNQLPRALVPPGRCPLPASLSAYLVRCEDERGVARGGLRGDDLRAALAALGPGSIAIAARGGPFFADSDRLDPCPTCEVLVENLRGRGLGADALAPGVPPIPARTS